MASSTSNSCTVLTLPEPTRRTSRHTQCGVGSCRPWWLQKLANKYVFVLFFACMEIMQATFYSYFRSVITTLEKQFAVQSQTIGFVLSGKEISQVLCGLLLAYYGSKGNRPRWIACGMLIVSFACLIMVAPIFLYLGNDALRPVNPEDDAPKDLCHARDSWAVTSSFASTNVTDVNHLSSVNGPCDPELSSDTLSSLILLFFGGFIAGVGITMLVTLTYPYLDDNVTKSASVLYIAIVTGLQVMGPTVGSVLGGLCLRLYVTLSDNPGISPDDPKWIGAWWLGFVVIAIAFGAGALIIVFFPRQLNDEGANDDFSTVPETVQDISNNNKEESSKVNGLGTALKRLLRNKILIFHGAARCFILFGTNGFDTFQPKYIESHFRQTASEASFFTGISGNAMRIVGILILGVVLRYWKPKAIFVTAWNIILDCIYIGSLVALILISCPTVEIVGLSQTALNSHQPINAPFVNQIPCSGNCSCSNVKFTPVCLDNKNYFSPCHAGCTSYNGLSQKSRVYHNCSCASNDIDEYLDFSNFTDASAYSTVVPEVPTATSGYCPFSCSSFTIYLIVLGAMRTLMATRKVSRMLIILRCLDEGDKSIGIALHTLMESVFAYIPCPIIYGVLLDSACIMWGSNCGQKGNCWLYDSDYLRYMMQGLTLVVISCGTLLDGYVLYLCRSLSLFEDPDTEKNPKMIENTQFNDKKHEIDCNSNGTNL